MSELCHCLVLLFKCLQAYWMPVQSQYVYLEASKGQNVSRRTHHIPLHENVIQNKIVIIQTPFSCQLC